MAIAVGAACITRGTTAPASYTFASKNGAADGTGTITSVCVYPGTNMTGIEFAVFEDKGANVLDCGGNTDGSNLAATTGEAPKTFTSAGLDFVAFVVNTGEYAGIYYTGGGLRLDNAGVSYWWLNSDEIFNGNSDTFSSSSPRIISLLMAGVEGEPPEGNFLPGSFNRGMNLGMNRGMN